MAQVHEKGAYLSFPMHSTRSPGLAMQRHTGQNTPRKAYLPVVPSLQMKYDQYFE